MKPRDDFTWEVYKGRPRRRGYCGTCTPQYRKEYHERAAPEQSRTAHNAWRERCLAAGGDKAVAWYFRRKLSHYRALSKREGLPECTLTVELLLAKFHAQEKRCYYTGELMHWNNYGVGKGNAPPQALSVDRLDPALGYTDTNTVLCTNAVIVAKNWRTEAEFYALCEQVLAQRTQRSNGQ